MRPCRVLDLDFLDYTSCLTLMRELAEARALSGPDILILVEHEPVVTLGRRGRDNDVKARPEALTRAGVTVHNIERGGLATYHGPGQLVVYPIFQFHYLGLTVPDLVDRLEEIVIRSLRNYGIQGHTSDRNRGVWVGRDKIAFIGMAVKRGVSFHGLALNNDPDMSHFDLIIPCGLQDVGVTSIKKLTGQAASSRCLRDGLLAGFAQVLNLTLEPWSLDQALDFIKRCKYDHS